jgi:centromeric protein E
LLGREKHAGTGWFVQPETNTVSQLVPADAYHKRAGIYAFDEVYDEQHSTQSIYDGMARTIARSALDGIHGSIFAYGQTSSGKTHTMQGTSLRSSSSSSSSQRLDGNQDETEADRRPARGDGIIQLAVKDLFDEMARRADASFSVRVSYIEIYNEAVRDLLDPSNGAVSVREHPVTGVFTDNSERIVSDARGVLKALRDGEKNRSVGSTAMNERSSRSHSIFRMVIESRTKQMDMVDDSIDNQAPGIGGGNTSRVIVENVRVGCLNFVDLAGSESARMTGSKGKRSTEASNINRSLLALSRVVSALSSRRRNGSSSASSPHINFRDSKLTRILQPSLSGAARVLFICCASPANHLVEDTRNTLKFATRAKRIKLNVTVNEVTDQQTRALIDLKQENQQLREQIEMMAMQDAEKLSAMEHLTADLKNHIEALELAMATMRSSESETAPVTSDGLDTTCKGPEDNPLDKDAINVVVIDDDEGEAPSIHGHAMDDMASPVSSLATTERASMLECCSSCSRLEDELKAVMKRDAHSRTRIEQLELELSNLKQEAELKRRKQIEILIGDDDELRGTGDEELADSDMDTVSEADSVSPLTSPFSPRPGSSWRSRVAQATSLPSLVAVTLAAITIYCVAGTLTVVAAQ